MTSEKKPSTAKIYQLVWRWHFWAGLLISPILIVVAITGALYVFKSELERYMYPELMFVQPAETRVSHSDFEKNIASEFPDSELHFIKVSKEPDRAWIAFIQNDSDKSVRYVYFDQYQGKVLGHKASDEGFFRVVRDIHRHLMGGTFGRLVVEVSTCWGIVSMLAGLYLWWPRKKEKIKGVWIPRVRGNFRTILRDWHTVPAAYFSIFVIIIMLSGLFFTKVWGTGFKISTALTGGFPAFYVRPPQSAKVEDHSIMQRIALDEAVRIANESYQFEGRSYEIDFPHPNANQAFKINTDISEPFADVGVVFIDQYTGNTILTATSEDLSWRTRAILLFYPIHVGSVYGLTTQILAVLSCLILTAMCVTGVWMWWRRRPTGKMGAPKKGPPKTAPKWMAWLTIILAIFMPTVGISLILMGLFQWIARKTAKSQTV